jgi:uncharacterized membrane protein YfcA
MILRNRTIEMKWAFFFIIMMLLWMVMERIVGLHGEHIDQHAIYTNFILFPAFLIYYFALKDKRENFYKGSMSYAQGLFSGLVITGIVTLITPALQFVTTIFISPNFFKNMTTYVLEQELMTEAKAAEYFNLKNYVIQATLGAPIMGIIISLIVAAFTKKD